MFVLLGIYHSSSWSHNKERVAQSLKGNGKIRVVVSSTALNMGVNFPDIRYIINWGHKWNSLYLGIYHSSSWSHNKERVAQSLKGNGKIRVVVSSTALNMGVNFPDIRYIINWGPACNLLDQHQEIGWAGRDGLPSHSIILYHGQQLSQCEQDVKDFVRADGSKLWCNNGYFKTSQFHFRHCDLSERVSRQCWLHNQCTKFGKWRRTRGWCFNLVSTSMIAGVLYIIYQGCHYVLT